MHLSLSMPAITIPVKPFVKKYIQTKYHCQSWHYTRNDSLGKYFYALLHRQPAAPDKYRLEKEKLTVEIPISHANIRGIYLDQDAVDDFNEFVYELIVEGIVEYIKGIVNRDGIKKYPRVYFKTKGKTGQIKRYLNSPDLMQFIEIKEVIADRLLRYNITENDIQIETIRKNVYRRMKIPLTASKSA